MTKGVLPQRFVIKEKYHVLLLIKTSTNAETYRLKGLDGKLYVLKLFNFLKPLFELLLDISFLNLQK